VSIRFQSDVKVSWDGPDTDFAGYPVNIKAAKPDIRSDFQLNFKMPFCSIAII
jgi:hypothetical protein